MFPFDIVPVENETNKELMRLFKGERDGFVCVGPKKYLLPAAYEKQAEGYYNIDLRPDDIWVITYPRSGTTVTQELVWLLNNNLDFESAMKYPLQPSRFPFLEFSVLHHPSMHSEVLSENPQIKNLKENLAEMRVPGYEVISKMLSPRHIKSHLPLSLLPPKLVKTCKVIYVARNAKDVAASYYHHNKLVKVHDYQGDFEKYWELFENDLLIYSPYFEHIKEAWNLRNEPNMYFLDYEDLVLDQKSTIKKLANFLGKVISDEQVDQLSKHIEINNFRDKLKLFKDTDALLALSNPTAQGFVRRGKVGGNKEFTDELSKRADKWIKYNLSNTDLKFQA